MDLGLTQRKRLRLIFPFYSVSNGVSNASTNAGVAGLEKVNSWAHAEGSHERRPAAAEGGRRSGPPKAAAEAARRRRAAEAAPPRNAERASPRSIE